jgi:predicted Zn-dependent peptidase
MPLMKVIDHFANEPEVHVLELSNGLRIVHQHLDRAVAHCGLMIGSGSRHEKKNEHGLAHFLEHCLFKGTEKRKTYHILSRLDAVGGELNAFTSKEETWVHASFLSHDYERAIELIADIVFFANFPEKEIEKEKEVIIDEINSYKDSPADMIFEDFDEVIFGKGALGRSILGTEQSLDRFGSKELAQFRERILARKNLIFSSAGNIPIDALVTLVEKHMGAVKLKKQPPQSTHEYAYKPQDRVEIKDIHQVHYVMGTTAYAFEDARRPALGLLNNLLGGPAMNNRLSMNIRERHGIAYHVDSNYAPFSDCGVFTIYVGSEKKHLEKSKQLIWKELDLLKAKALTPHALQEAKKQIMGQIALSQDSGSAIMFNLAKSLMLFGEIDTLQEVFRRLQLITADELVTVAREIFDPSIMSSITYSYD